MKYLVVAAALVACAAASCVEERERALSLQESGMMGAFVPECEADGSWSALQCHGSTGWCHCRLADGSKVNTGSRVLTNCECPIARYQVLKKHLFGAHVPKCEETGLFKKVQCHSRYCHCAHPVTGERVSEPVHFDQIDSLKC